MLIRPIQTEKTYAQQTKNIYMFLVPAKSSKPAIKAAVQQEYQVSVLSVRTLTRKGKSTRFSRGKHAYPGTTYRQTKCFAYVTLKDGDKIKVFDEEPTEETKTTKSKTTNQTTDAKQNDSTKKVGLFSRRRTGRRGDK
jgi:large subunit ribosomal protein L23